MNTLNTFKTQGQQPFNINAKKPTDESMENRPARAQSQWRRVLDVILVEGEIRYLVERGE